MRVRVWSVFASLLLVGSIGCGSGGGSSSSSEPSGPTLDLAPGFTPDPATRTGTTSGTTDATTHGGSCRGHIGSSPDFTINATGAFDNLRVVVSAPEDTTLVIEMADGTYRCDDDGGEGTNPLVEGAFPAGRHKVYIGSYSANQQIAWTAGVTELASVTATTLGGGEAEEPPAADTAASGSNFGTVTLSPGFTPDPHTATGAAGGGTDANTLNSDCRGWVASQPDHLLVTTADFRNLRVMTNSEQDTTLVIRMPDGSYRCDDDGSGVGMNPLVEGAFPAGTYQIYVGTYSAEATGVAYTLGFSELSSVTPTALTQ